MYLSSGSAQCIRILISTFCASASSSPLALLGEFFLASILLINTATPSLLLSLQMLQHNQKFPLFFPSCIISRFPCVRSRERKLKVIRSLLFLYPLFVCVSVGFLSDAFFGIRSLSALMLISEGGWQIKFLVIFGLILRNDGMLFIWINPSWYVNKA